jgi:hypothetical protein
MSWSPELPFPAQVGVVWKEVAIIEVSEGAKKGVSSFFLLTRKSVWSEEIFVE